MQRENRDTEAAELENHAGAEEQSKKATVVVLWRLMGWAPVILWPATARLAAAIPWAAATP